MPNLLATLPANPDLWESILFILNGFVFVLIVLGVMGVFSSLMGLCFQRLTPVPARAPQMARPPARPVVSAPSLPSAAAPASPVAAEPDAHLAVVIAAAAHVALSGRAHRVVTIRPAPADWAVEGRRSIHSARKVR